jgi:hypothetical protein
MTYAGKNPRQQLYPVKRSAIITHWDFIFAAAVAELEHRFRLDALRVSLLWNFRISTTVTATVS